MGVARPPAGDSDYSAWPWEMVLANVLGIAIPDRAQVTGQSWISIGHDHGGAPGSHLIWTASWQSSPGSGASSIQIYLNPALYAAGGSWDGFLNAPLQALTGPGNALPLIPQTFQAAHLALAGVTSGINTVSQHFDSLHHAATTETTPFHGNAADVIAELFGGLHGVTLSIYDQMTIPHSYADAVGAAGDAATAFLADIRSAYTAWSQLPAHSPLGALVQVLEAIATQDGSGAYTIPDPRNTPYGDLTADAGWAPVEQQAKNAWLGLLTGGSGAFGGLDLLGQTALSKLVGEYTTTTGTIVPVVGPAPTAIQPPPANSGPNRPGSGPPRLTANPQGPGGHGPGGSGRGVDLAAGGIPPVGGPGGPVPAHAAASFIARPAGTAGGPGSPGSTGTSGATGPQAGFFPAVGLGAVGVAGLPGQTTAAGPGTSAGPGRKDLTTAGPRGLNIPGTAGVLSGAIGSTASRDAGGPGHLPGGAGLEAVDGFTGTIGQSAGATGRTGGRPARDRGSHGHLAIGMAGPVRTAPAAGFSLGGNGHGLVLQQSAVPVISSKPPPVASSSINVQLTPAGSGTGGPGLPGLPGNAPVGGLVPGEGSPVMIASAGDSLGGPGVQAGWNGPVVMPPATALSGTCQQGEVRERLAYLPEDEDYWGTDPELPAVGAGDSPVADEPDFDGPRLIVGIGAEAELLENMRTRPDRRMP